MLYSIEKKVVLLLSFVGCLQEILENACENQTANPKTSLQWKIRRN